MLTLLVLLLIRKAKKQQWLRRVPDYKKMLRLRMLVFLVMLAGMLPFTTLAQTQCLNYRIVQNDNNIGWIKIQKKDSGETSHIKLDSEVKKRMVFQISVIEKQEVAFHNGFMVQSYVYRKVNDEVKMNRHTSFTGNIYEIKDPGSLERLSIQRVQYNQLSLYFNEPVNINEVYSDNHQRFLKIEPKGNSVYKIRMPNGNYNHYYYKNGVCSRVRVEHDLFTIEFIRVDPGTK